MSPIPLMGVQDPQILADFDAPLCRLLGVSLSTMRDLASTSAVAGTSKDNLTEARGIVEVEYEWHQLITFM